MGWQGSSSTKSNSCTIKVGKAEEVLEFFDCHRHGPLSHSSHLGRVHSYTFLADDVPLE